MLLSLVFVWQPALEALLRQKRSEARRQTFFPTLRSITGFLNACVYVLVGPKGQFYVGYTMQGEFRLIGHAGSPVNAKMSKERKDADYSQWDCLVAIEVPGSPLSTVVQAAEIILNLTLAATADEKGVNKHVFDVSFYCRTPRFSAAEVVTFVRHCRQQALLPKRKEKSAWQSLAKPCFASPIAGHYAYGIARAQYRRTITVPLLQREPIPAHKWASGQVPYSVMKKAKAVDKNSRRELTAAEKAELADIGF